MKMELQARRSPPSLYHPTGDMWQHFRTTRARTNRSLPGGTSTQAKSYTKLFANSRVEAITYLQRSTFRQTPSESLHWMESLNVAPESAFSDGAINRCRWRVL